MKKFIKNLVLAVLLLDSCKVVEQTKNVSMNGGEFK